MCGVVGIVGPHADTAGGRAWVEQALQDIEVRGPDASGIWHAPGALLGHRRLSIRDLSESGAQPMVAADGGIALVYNGEIYDTKRLAGPLLARGWSPRGHSDTELLLQHLIHNRMLQAPEQVRQLQALVGMFAFGAWSTDERRLLLARDRIGIKPLYYAELDQGVAFCSEPVPLGRAPGATRTIDPEALHWYLCLGVIPAPWSLNAGVRQLRPGHALTWTKEEGTRVSTWGRLPLPASAERPPSEPTTREALEALLLEVVRDQLVSDVPVGVLLSGGVDSSLVAAAAARAGGQIDTFSIVHPNPDYDERVHARAVARHLGTRHHELELPSGGMTADELEELVRRTGDPFADSSALPMRRLSGLIREHVTVALSGDGGDELFAGYDRYLLASRLRRLKHVPRRARRATVRAWKLLDPLVSRGRTSELARRVARAAMLSLRDGGEQSLGTISYMFPEEVRPRLRPGLRTPQEHQDLVRDQIGLDAPAAPDAWFLHWLEQHVNLVDRMLVKVDRTSMGASLEVRPCLLDDRVVDAAARVPFDQKIRGSETKAILKEIARDWVPPEVVDRPKKGFAIPLLAYGGSVLDDAGAWALRSETSPLRSVFTEPGLEQLWQELESPPRGRSPEDSAYRLAHRRWLLILLAKAIEHQRLEVG